MLSKILSNYLVILVLILAGCEEFYNFEANKLDKKAEELIERSEIVSNTDEKIKLLLNALIKIKMLQKPVEILFASVIHYCFPKFWYFFGGRKILPKLQLAFFVFSRLVSRNCKNPWGGVVGKNKSFSLPNKWNA